MYNDADLVSFKNISVAAKDEQLDVLLKRVFTGMNFLYEGNVIIVKPAVAKDDEKKDVKKFIVKGKVIDEKKQPLPGVTIRLDSTTVGLSLIHISVFD